YLHCLLRHLPSFPTRRSSDLGTGQVTGSFHPGTYPHAFLWTPSVANGTSGSALDLGTLGGIQSNGVGVNDSGQVVGDSTLSNGRSEEHTSELQSRSDLVCRLL